MDSHSSNDNGPLRREKEIAHLRKLFDRQPRDDKEFNFQGVLLSDAIEQCVASFGLITPFNRDNLKAASYKLTVGDEYSIGGKIESLPDESGKNKIVIPPFAVAIVKTQEIINMPRFLIGRWNIQVSKAYEGLLWVGGPQVDPGYVGYLFCPIYNLRDKDVELTRGNPIAVIDFVRTTPVNSQSKEFKFPPDKVLFDDYDPQTLISGLVTGTKERIDKLQETLGKTVSESRDELSDLKQTTRTGLQEMGSKIDNFVLITFSVIAVLFAAITIFVTGTDRPIWRYPILFVISGTAIFLSCSAWLKIRSQDQLLSRAFQIVVVLLLVVCACLQLWLEGPLQSQIDSLKNEIELLKQEKLNTQGIKQGDGMSSDAIQQQSRENSKMTNLTKKAQPKENSANPKNNLH